MAKSVKCPHCGVFFDRDRTPFVHIKNRYWHKVCYDAVVMQSAQAELDLKNLEEYIIKIFNVEYVDARIKRQLKDMINNYGFTYSGIHKTLIYWFDVRKNSIEKANGGLGIVPYVYEEAKKYFYTIYMAQQQNNGKDIDKYVIKGKRIRIAPPERKVKPVQLIDLELLLEEE